MEAGKGPDVELSVAVAESFRREESVGGGKGGGEGDGGGGDGGGEGDGGGGEGDGERVGSEGGGRGTNLTRSPVAV